MAKSGRKSTSKECMVMKPLGVSRIKRAVQTLYAQPKSQKWAQVIIHDREARGNTTVLDTVAQQSMVGMGVWEIIKRHNISIDAQGVNMGDSSKEGCCLQLVDSRGALKNRLGEKP